MSPNSQDIFSTPAKNFTWGGDRVSTIISGEKNFKARL
jgi:hypothetical protein